MLAETFVSCRYRHSAKARQIKKHIAVLLWAAEKETG